MSNAIEFPGEDKSNADRRAIAQHEPISLRTFTPSQAVVAKSSGIYHYTADGRRLYDYTSGVLAKYAATVSQAARPASRSAAVTAASEDPRPR